MGNGEHFSRNGTSLPVAAAKEDAPSPGGYPHFESGLPRFEYRMGPYCARFAHSWQELDRVFALRYEVFNRELGEGSPLSESSERDEDLFDRACHHLLVVDERDEQIVGTYRLMTQELAVRGPGFYSAREFELDALPEPVLAQGVELGRACIAKSHRAKRVLFLLWRGIGAYVLHNRKRFLFGCASVPTFDAAQLISLGKRFREQGVVHPELWLSPCEGYHPRLPDDAPTVEVATPSLLRSYFSMGASVCGGPAIDRDFGCTDYFVLFDAASIDDATYQRYTGA